MTRLQESDFHAHRHLTPKQFGLWLVALQHTDANGLLTISSLELARLFANTSYKAILRIIDQLLTKEFFALFDEGQWANTAYGRTKNEYFVRHYEKWLIDHQKPNPKNGMPIAKNGNGVCSSEVERRGEGKAHSQKRHIPPSETRVNRPIAKNGNVSSSGASGFAGVDRNREQIEPDDDAIPKTGMGTETFLKTFKPKATLEELPPDTPNLREAQVLSTYLGRLMNLTPKPMWAVKFLRVLANYSDMEFADAIKWAFSGKDGWWRPNIDTITARGGEKLMNDYLTAKAVKEKGSK